MKVAACIIIAALLSGCAVTVTTSFLNTRSPQSASSAYSGDADAAAEGLSEGGASPAVEASLP